MKLNEEFIKEYKDLEDTARSLGTDIFTIEKSCLSDKDQRMLQICRLKRNWLQHEDNTDEFELATPRQIQFIKELSTDLKKRNGICKDYMITLAKYGCCDVNDTIYKAAQILKQKKSNHLIVMKNNDFAGTLSKDTISDLFAEGITKSSKIGDKIEETPVTLIDEAEPVPKDKGLYLVTKGRNRRIVGVLTV